MSPTSSPDPLLNWRLSWRPEELEWRTGALAEGEQQTQEREQRRAARQIADRGSFGRTLWGVSAKHRNAQPDLERLARYDLPVLASEADLAEWLGLPLSRLRWFTYDREAELHWHYVRYTLAKRTGGTRVILAPKRELKALQRKVLHGILDRL